jgi:DNA-binding NarL/FixJ family response regulator
VARTILRIEQSTLCFDDFASQLEYHARKRALERLDSVYGPPPATILLVDPHKEDREYWKQRLKMSSPEAVILEADTGKAGLAICHLLRVDCVVMESSLSDMLGVELLVNLVPRSKHPEIPVIVLSRQLLVPELTQVALSNGAQACLVKSRCSGDDLDKAIQKAIAIVGPRKHREP